MATRLWADAPTDRGVHMEDGDATAPAGTQHPVTDAVDRVMELRREIQEAGPRVPQSELEDRLAEADQVLRDVRFFGDLALEAFFSGKKAKERETVRQGHFQALQDQTDSLHRERLAGKRRDSPPFAPFHWEIEFPEVFDRKNPGSMRSSGIRHLPGRTLWPPRTFPDTSCG